MIEHITHLWLNPYIAVGLYWIPLIASLIRGGHKVITQYFSELKQYKIALDTNKYFTPRLSIGTIVGDILIAVIPVVNIFVTIFSFLPGLISRTFNVLDTLLSIKLVPSHEPTIRLKG
jgi:hypothetical protein